MQPLRTSIVLLAILPLLHAPGSAQQRVASPLTVDAAGATPRPRADLAPIVFPADAARGRSGWRTAALLGSGVAVGGWLGYFASHVRYSDWERPRGGDFKRERLQYTVAGGAAGALAGVALGWLSGGTSPADVRSARGRAIPTITREEIEASSAGNGLELVQALRPSWLQQRGVSSFRETTTAEAEGMGGITNVRPGVGGIQVYLDDARLGGVETLTTIDPTAIERVEFHDAPQATFRWGTGHPHGAILFRSR